MKLKLKDILPSPFRDLTTSPLKTAKLEELKKSIGDTGFWDNVVVRKNADGKYELAYGHHRVQAAINCGITEADFIVKKLDDTTMIKIMDNENREAYGTDLLSVMESIQAVVRALDAGKIKEFIQPGKTRETFMRYAPSYIPGKLPCGPESGPHSKVAYTASDVAQFLGRLRKEHTPEDVVNAAFAVLELEEHKVEGWSRKALLTKYKALRTIPVDSILQDAASAKKIARQRYEAEVKKGAAATEHGVEATATLNQLLAESIAAEEEDKRLDDEYAEAKREGNVAEAKRLTGERKTREAEDKERAKQIKDAKKAEKKAVKAAAKKAETAIEKAKKAEVTAAKNWLDHNETLIGKITRTFNEDDGLYAELNKWKTNPRTTSAQRSAIQLALRDLSGRAANFNPFTGPKTKGDSR